MGRKVKGFLYSWRIIARFEHDNIVRICQSEIGPLDTGRSDHGVHERSYQQFNKVIVNGQSQVGWEMSFGVRDTRRWISLPVFLFGYFVKYKIYFHVVQSVDHFLQISSSWCSLVTQLCPILCDPMDCSMPGFPVLHCLPEFVQTQVHWVSDAIQPSHPLSPPSPALNLLLSVYNYKVLDHQW